VHVERLDAGLGLWKIESETNGYLVVRGERSLLIDCPERTVGRALRAAGLPLPDTILHTQVQEEHCREWGDLAEARVYVAEASADVATRSRRFFAECRTVWPPSREWESRGEEKYGLGGCTTERPPRRALNVAGTLRPDTTFRWKDVLLEVAALPGSGKRSIGLFWRDADILFSGDLVRAGGFLVNFYDLERSYGLPSGYDELRRSIAAVRRLAPRTLLPSTGPAITHPKADCERLLARIAWVYDPPKRRATQACALTNYRPRREFGRYREVADGVFQNNNAGNIILFVDERGRGLMIDPDPCVWFSWETNVREVNGDLDLLEREAGLKRIEFALPTHYHGDHVEYVDLIRERYGAKFLATPDVAAVLERPKDFRYPCVVDWYGFPFDHVQVDGRLAYGRPFLWHGVPIVPVHTPGHCYAHTGYFIRWKGLRIFCSGDVLQYGAGPISVPLPVVYSDTAWPDRGVLVAFERIAALEPDLVLGGHSHSFFDRRGTILRHFCWAARQSLELARDMIAGGDLLRAMTPPGYDEKRPEQDVPDCP